MNVIVVLTLQTILFTTDEDILEQVSQFDKTFEADIYMEDDLDDDVERPSTADNGQEDVSLVYFDTSI